MLQKNSLAQELSQTSGHGYRRLFWLMFLRLGLTTLLLGSTLIVNYQNTKTHNDPSFKLIIGQIAFTYMATILYALWYRTGKKMLILAWIQISADFIFWGGLAFATGGIASGFNFLFGLWTVAAAVVIGGRAAFIGATISSGVLLLLALSATIEATNPLMDQDIPHITINEMLYFLGVNITGVFVVAALVTSLVAKLEQTGKGLEKERAEKADLAALHSDVIRSLTSGILIVNNDREIVTINPEGKRLLKQTENAKQQTTLQHIFPDLSDYITKDSKAKLRGHGVALNTSNRKVPVEYSVTPLFNAEGNLRGNIVVFNDLSNVKQLEADLEKSRKLAALGELAASMAHEIRNPLSAVSGSFQMLKQSAQMDEEDKTLSDIISRELSRLERLVNDMLDYSRPRSPNLQNLNITQIVDDIVKAFRMAQEANNRIVLYEKIQPTYCHFDPFQIRQVIWNLLRNAAQISDEGKQIQVQVYKNEELETIIEVIDFGPGVPDDLKTQIFKPFYSTRERGLGLGLAICSRIIKGHNGKIEVVDSKNEGATFRITLPN